MDTMVRHNGMIWIFFTDYKYPFNNSAVDMQFYRFKVANAARWLNDRNIKFERHYPKFSGNVKDRPDFGMRGLLENPPDAFGFYNEEDVLAFTLACEV